MSYALILDFPDGTRDTYKAVVDAGGDALRVNPERESHYMWERPEGGITVFGVYSSQEEIAKVGEMLGPILEEHGTPSKPPVVVPIASKIASDGVWTVAD